MSMNKVKLSQIVRDFIVTLDGDDYVSNASDAAIRNFALRGIREIGFDLGKKIRSIKVSKKKKSLNCDSYRNSGKILSYFDSSHFGTGID